LFDESEESNESLHRISFENENHSYSTSDWKLYLLCVYASFLEHVSKYAMTLLGFMLPPRA